MGEVHLVVLRGELDMATAEGLADWLTCIVGLTVVVDLTELTFMDSSGITPNGPESQAEQGKRSHSHSSPAHRSACARSYGSDQLAGRLGPPLGQQATSVVKKLRLSHLDLLV